jgi:hypothetical protein
MFACVPFSYSKVIRPSSTTHSEQGASTFRNVVHSPFSGGFVSSRLRDVPGSECVGSVNGPYRSRCRIVPGTDVNLDGTVEMVTGDNCGSA